MLLYYTDVNYRMLIIVHFFWFFNKLEAKFGVENNLMGSLVCLDIVG